MVEQTVLRFLSDYVMFGLDMNYDIVHINKYLLKKQPEHEFAYVKIGYVYDNPYVIRLLFKDNEIHAVEITDTMEMMNNKDFIKSIVVDCAYLLGDLLVFTNNSKHVLTINKDLNSVKYNDC